MHRKWKEHPPNRLVAKRNIRNARRNKSGAEGYQAFLSIPRFEMAPTSNSSKAARTLNSRRCAFPELCLIALVFLFASVSMTAAANTDQNRDFAPPGFGPSTNISGAASIKRDNPVLPEYLLSTPQIIDPLKPLLHLADIASDMTEHIIVHAAVVSVADPLETHLGRAFDIQLSSLIRAFHSQDYVVDAFAFTWDPKYSGSTRTGKRIPEGGATAFAEQQRSMPSVLLFRKDLWRERAPGPGEPIGAEYFIVFLVGESPTFGVQPDAFRKAAQCAAALNDIDNDRPEKPNNWISKRCSNVWEYISERDSEAVLQVIGPSFSGSMQSLALAAGSLGEANPWLKIELISPSATVTSNKNVGDWVDLLSASVRKVDYHPLAASLKDQLIALCDYMSDHRIDEPIVFLAEESTFGRGVADLLKSNGEAQGQENASSQDSACKKDPDEWRKFVESARVTSFSQNISAIRAEHSRSDQQANELLRESLQSQSSLLKLDLSTVDESMDRPPAYHRSLSSRSDELMLYGTFNALSVWVKPAIVAIVATDVRDRLFLLNEIRKSIPTALPVLMEMDYLTAHPDYRKISRGAMVIPNGETLLCLDKTFEQLTPCGKNTIYLAFPSDYAANMFKAIFNLIKENDNDASDQIDNKKDNDKVSHKSVEVSLWVTTLAGFQKISEDRPSPRLLAADSRLSLERPAYSFFLLFGISIIVVSIWLRRHCCNYLVMMSPVRNSNPFHGIQERETCRESATGSPTSGEQCTATTWSRRITVTLIAAGGLVALIAIAQLGRLYGWLEPPYRGQGYTWGSLGDLNLPWWVWDLAHGRDILALTCLYVIYLCVALLAFWRLYLWGSHCHIYMSVLDTGAGKASNETGSNQNIYLKIVGFFSLFFLFMVTLFYVLSRGVPTAVDSPWPSVAVSLSLLGLGALFLVILWTESRSWAILAQLLAPTIEMLRRSRYRPEILKDNGGEFRWPSPVLLNELPQSPFSLHFRERDLMALNRESKKFWASQTLYFLKGEWPFAPTTGYTFELWQARLVAEMRCAAVAVRSAAWCGILAPITVLLSMSIYPPFDERLLTTASVTLIVIGFAMAIYIALRLEQHPLLGRMFTQHGDKLTIGGAFGALWGKLVAASIILVPVLFPDFLDWVYELLQSINSLR